LRKVPHEDIIKEIQRHAFYLNLGQKKRAKEALARKRNRKKRNRDSEIKTDQMSVSNRSNQLSTLAKHPATVVM